MALEEVRQNQDIHGRVLQNILRGQAGQTPNAGRLPAGATFPLKDIEEFKAMEAKLTDEAFVDGIVSIFYE